MTLLSKDDSVISRVTPRLNRYLAARDRSESEVRLHLANKKLCRRDEADRVIEFLRQEGFIDDARFARNRVDFRIRNGRGPLYIKRELARFRIDSSRVNEILRETGDEPFIENAVVLLEKRLPGLINEENSEQRLRNLLLSRGYIGLQIDGAVRELQQRYPHWSNNIERDQGFME